MHAQTVVYGRLGVTLAVIGTIWCILNGIHLI